MCGCDLTIDEEGEEGNAIVDPRIGRVRICTAQAEVSNNGLYSFITSAMLGGPVRA